MPSAEDNYLTAPRIWISTVTGLFGPFPILTPGHLGPNHFRSGSFGLDRSKMSCLGASFWPSYYTVLIDNKQEGHDGPGPLT